MDVPVNEIVTGRKCFFIFVSSSCGYLRHIIIVKFLYSNHAENYQCGNERAEINYRKRKRHNRLPEVFREVQPYYRVCHWHTPHQNRFDRTEGRSEGDHCTAEDKTHSLSLDKGKRQQQQSDYHKIGENEKIALYRRREYRQLIVKIFR